MVDTLADRACLGGTPQCKRQKEKGKKKNTESTESPSPFFPFSFCILPFEK
jgi:hypothetical protein